jgi:hypothetical protein
MDSPSDRSLTSRKRVTAALAVAVAADLFQLGLGPLGWTFVDEIVDVAAMIFLSSAIGFHPLLLPTFLIELIPVADMLPTWTGCTLAVIYLRRRPEPPSAHPAPTPITIDPSPHPQNQANDPPPRKILPGPS